MLDMYGDNGHPCWVCKVTMVTHVGDVKVTMVTNVGDVKVTMVTHVGDVKEHRNRAKRGILTNPQR